MMPFSLTLVVLAVGTLGPEREVPIGVSTFWECAGGGAQQRAQAWLADHPNYRLVRTSCRMGAAATEKAI